MPELRLSEAQQREVFTEMYPMSIKPAREGVYPVGYLARWSTLTYYAKWNGTAWQGVFNSIEAAQKDTNQDESGWHLAGGMYWRGFTCEQFLPRAQEAPAASLPALEDPDLRPWTFVIVQEALTPWQRFMASLQDAKWLVKKFIFGKGNF